MDQPPISDPSGRITPGTPAPRKEPAEDLIGLARAQRWGVAMLCVSVFTEAAGVALKFMGEEFDKSPQIPVLSIFLALTLLGGVVIAIGFRVWTVYRLARHLRIRPAFVPAALSVFGCIGLYVLYSLNKRAAQKLRVNGLRVGTFGVTKAELAGYQSSKATTS